MNFHQSSKKLSILTPDTENNLNKPPKNPFKRQNKVQQWFTTRGSYVHDKPMVKIFGGIPKMLVLLQFSQNIDGFRQNYSQGF